MGNDIAPAPTAYDPVGDGLQQEITYLVTEGVINEFKAVQIQEKDCT